MVELIGSFKALRKVHVFVIGDFVLDVYIKGSVSRISPEAPVAVLHAKEQFQRPGMAGNVALNLVSLGAEVSVCGRIGSDPFGKNLIKSLEEDAINTSAMVAQRGYATPAKNRMIANSQQLLRVDFETITSLSKTLEKRLIEGLDACLASVDVVAISDYKKGFLTKNLTRAVINAARAKKIPVIVDPKGDDFSKYERATLIKPNVSEAYYASKFDRDKSLDKVCEVLLKDSKADYILVTRSEEGMSLFNKDFKREDFTVKSREVKDVTGAGDTVLAMMTMGMGNNLSPDVCVSLANLAASIAIQKVGCVRVTLSQIAEKLLHFDALNKIFSEDHFFALKQVLKGRTFTVLSLDDGQEMTTHLFHTIRSLHDNAGEDHRLIVYLKDCKSSSILISLLSSLREVDFILHCSSSLSKLFFEISPKAIYHMKEDSLKKIKDPTVLLDELSLLSKVK
ncbi:HldE protein [Candidatus Aerophobetes bacterium]|uniref:HldE protein n=1 Tax=Aerophobetes bacterium TaxID=2030807 RepID=A0A2A4YIY1_UNCAE|nr:MAG: HldE protein [Candidatus Aerophobetes bacterium]